MDTLAKQIKNLPTSSGVYLFKDEYGHVIYIAKAKNLKKRVSSYLVHKKTDVKAATIIDSSYSLDHIPTATELEALILEARLIQSYSPKHNIIFKGGQPFLYIMITMGKLPEVKLVRNRKRKGVYFGPFIEKTPARKVFDFLVKTFRLKLCKKKIDNGCLYYHMGICSGSCRPDFDKQAYLDRLELARKSLAQGHKKFLAYLKKQIDLCNSKQEFEKARDFHKYFQAFESVFNVLETKPSLIDTRIKKDVWVLTRDRKALFLFSERDNILKKKRVFYLSFAEHEHIEDLCREYFVSYYRAYQAPVAIVVNFNIPYHEKKLLEDFLKAWHKRELPVSIIAVCTEEQARDDRVLDSYNTGVMRMALIQAEQELAKHIALPKALKRLLQTKHEIHTIDCFDVSHKQGFFLVGSCVRFTDGQPDKNKFRRFKIKTVKKQDDYASLREIVSRRYKSQENKNDFPDVILIDGGKGQLNAVQDLFPDVTFVSLAKREETIFLQNFPRGKVLDQKTYAAQVLIAIRDYAHHFAISYHRMLSNVIEE